MAIAWSFTIVVEQANDKNIDHHADVAVHCGAHCLMEHIRGITRSHRMLPLDKCVRCIAPAATTDKDFVVMHKTLTKSYFLQANLGSFVREKLGIFGHETNPLLTLPMPQASFNQMLKKTNNFLEVGMYAISGYTVKVKLIIFRSTPFLVY